MSDGDRSPEDSKGTETPPPASGMEEIARDLLAPTGTEGTSPTPILPRAAEATPGTDAPTMRLADARAAEPTLPRGPSTPSRPRVPARLGPYLLGDELGHGGMGVVYRARHEKLGTDCAVKVLIAGEHASAELIARFQREAGAVAKMGKHPHVVTVFDLGEEAGLTYYAMELVEGRSLRAEMKDHPFLPRDAAALVEKTARALHFAHEHGIVHRDMKPDNIVVRKDGEPQVMDFGLAHDVSSGAHLSMTGQVMGTLAYMAPEQARGEVDKTDARTDVYALGGVLYELLAGNPPHAGNQIALVLPRILRGDIVAPRRLRADVPRDLETIAMKALSLEPARRYATAVAMADDLARWLRGEAILARPAGPLRKGWLLVKRHKAASAATAVVLAAATALGLAWYVTLGTLRLAVTPAEAEVRIDGRPARAGDLRLRAGGHTIDVSAPEHAPESREVLIERRGEKEMTIGLRHFQGKLAAECQEATSRIAVDGAEFGPRIPPLDFDTGTHVVRAHAPWHFDREERVQVERGQVASTAFWLDQGLLWEPYRSPNISGGPIPFEMDGSPQVIVLQLTDFLIVSARTGQLTWRSPEGYVTGQSAVRPIDLGGSVGRVLCCTGNTNPPIRIVDPRRKGEEKTLWTWSPPAEDGVEKPDCVIHVVDISEDDGTHDVVVHDIESLATYLLDGRNGQVRSRIAVPTAGRCQAFRIGGEGCLVSPSHLSHPDRECCSSVHLKDGAVVWRRELPPGRTDFLEEHGADNTAYDAFDARWILWSTPQEWQLLSTETGETVGAGTWELGGRLHGAIGRDLDGDGTIDGLAMVEGGRVAAVSFTKGKVLWESRGAVAVYHHSGPEGEVLMAQSDRLLALDPATGAVLWSVPGAVAGVMAADWDGDGVPELFVGLQGKGLACLGAGGRERWLLRLEVDPAPITLLQDVDGDGLPEVLLGGGAALVTVARGPRMLWERSSPQPLQATPLILDEGGTGALEVVQLGRWSGDRDLLCLDGRTGAERWGCMRTSAPNRAPGVGDWDGDGKLDICWGARTRIEGDPSWGFVVLRVTDGATMAQHAREDRPIDGYATPVMIDLNADRVADVAFQTWSAKCVFAMDGRTGATLWTHDTGEANMGGMGVADLDGDGRPDLVAPSLDGFVHAIRGLDGGTIWKAAIGHGSKCPPTVADLDGDGKPEVLVVDSFPEAGDGRLWVLDGRTGKVLWNELKGLSTVGRPAVVPIEGVGTAIVLSTGRSGVVAIDWAKRRVLWQTPVGKAVVSSSIVSDLDRDGKVEVVCVSWDGQIGVLDLATGRRLWGLALEDESFEADPAVGDLDGDGILDIVVAGQKGLHAVSGLGTRGARRRMK